MCFSASASFVASALLIPTGIYCLKQATTNNNRYIPLASIPLFFGTQQLFEGFVWLNIAADNAIAVTNFSFCFLFFSHFFWPFWIPFSAFYAEEIRLRKTILQVLATVGFVYGISLYVPLFFQDDWLKTEVVNHSINYITDYFLNQTTFQNFGFYLYAVLIFVPLLLASRRKIQLLGVFFMTTASATILVYYATFISTWCFMAALSSLYLIYVLKNTTDLDLSQSKTS